MAKVLKVVSLEEIKIAAEVIKKGGLVAFPTETVYGLGADALNERAVLKIFEAKQRPPDNPLIVHVSSFDEIEMVSYVNPTAKKLIEEFFPGPLAVIMKKKKIVPDVTTGGLDKVAVRMPDHRIALKLIEFSETPVAAPSANVSGKPSPTSAEHVIEDLANRVDIILDGGETSIGLESTVVDTTTYPVKIIRPGAVTKEMLSEFVDVEEVTNQKFSPGLKYGHYKPKSPLYVFVGDEDSVRSKILAFTEELQKKGMRAVIIARKDVYGKNVIEIGQSYEEMAKNLFSALRKADSMNPDVIVAEGVEERGIGEAIMNRLRKAAGERVFRV
jgi:L-threonylcarbamoyladenylate synthase